MLSVEFEKLVNEIYADSKVTPAEVIKLRRAVDEAVEGLLRDEGHHGVFDALFKSFDVTDQLLQECMLKLRKGDYTATAKARVVSALRAHLALLEATVKAFE